MVSASPGFGLSKAGKFGARAAKYKFGARFGKYKLEARAVKYKLGAMAGKDKLGTKAAGWGWGPSRGLGARKYKYPKKCHINESRT